MSNAEKKQQFLQNKKEEGDSIPTRFTTNSTIPCRNFSRGTCLKGANCPYSHDPMICNNEKLKDPCRFFAMGKCTNGSSCSFSHDLSKHHCRYHIATGVCPTIDKCPWMHGELAPGQKDKVNFVRINKSWLLSDDCTDAGRKKFKAYLAKSVRSDGSRIGKEEVAPPPADALDPLLAVPLSTPALDPLLAAPLNPSNDISDPLLATPLAKPDEILGEGDPVGDLLLDDDVSISHSDLLDDLGRELEGIPTAQQGLTVEGDLLMDSPSPMVD